MSSSHTGTACRPSHSATKQERPLPISYFFTLSNWSATRHTKNLSGIQYPESTCSYTLFRMVDTIHLKFQVPSGQLYAVEYNGVGISLNQCKLTKSVTLLAYIAACACSIHRSQRHLLEYAMLPMHPVSSWRLWLRCSWSLSWGGCLGQVDYRTHARTVQITNSRRISSYPKQTTNATTNAHTSRLSQSPRRCRLGFRRKRP